MKTVPITYKVKVRFRTGILWNAIFWLVFFTVGPLQLACLWLSKGVAVLSDLLRELCYRVWFEQIPPRGWDAAHNIFRRPKRQQQIK